MPMPRIVYAMAKDGLLFRFLATVHPKFKTPFSATLVTGALAAVFAMVTELDALVDTLPAQDVRDDSWDEAAHGFAAFTEHLLAHERNENAVVQQGYNEDFGYGD